MSESTVEVDPVPVEKYHGTGNDFVVVDAYERVPDRGAFATRICDPEAGIGADGVLFLALEPEPVPPRVVMTLFQPDGGTAPMCGNGARCAAAWAMARTGTDAVMVDTQAGSRRAEQADDGEIAVEMGRPSFDPTDVPVRAERPVVDRPVGELGITGAGGRGAPADGARGRAASADGGDESRASAAGDEEASSAANEEEAASATDEEEASAAGDEEAPTAAGEEEAPSASSDGDATASARNGTTSASGGDAAAASATGFGDELTVTAVDTGVPHAVAFVADVDAVDLESIAPPIRDAAAFPRGTNVTLASRDGDGFRQRTYERGVEGETDACGTGAVAIAVAARRLGLLDEEPVTVRPPGGELRVASDEVGRAVLEGPVVREFADEVPAAAPR